NAAPGVALSGDLPGVRLLRPELCSVERAHLALQVPVRAMDPEELPGELDCFLPVLCFDHGVAADHFLALRERPVLDADVAVTRAHAEALRRGSQPGGADELALADPVLD